MKSIGEESKINPTSISRSSQFFNPRWNLEQCLEEALILSNINDNRKDRIKKALNDFSMSEKYLSQNIRLFSGGELQRIS